MREALPGPVARTAAALARARETRHLCGKWPATPREMSDAAAVVFAVPVPALEKPSQRMRRLARAAELRRARLWRAARQAVAA